MGRERSYKTLILGSGPTGCWEMGWAVYAGSLSWRGDFGLGHLSNVQ